MKKIPSIILVTLLIFIVIFVGYKVTLFTPDKLIASEEQKIIISDFSGGYTPQNNIEVLEDGRTLFMGEGYREPNNYSNPKSTIFEIPKADTSGKPTIFLSLTEQLKNDNYIVKDCVDFSKEKKIICYVKRISREEGAPPYSIFCFDYNGKQLWEYDRVYEDYMLEQGKLFPVKDKVLFYTERRQYDNEFLGYELLLLDLNGTVVAERVQKSEKSIDNGLQMRFAFESVVEKDEKFYILGNWYKNYAQESLQKCSVLCLDRMLNEVWQTDIDTVEAQQHIFQLQENALSIICLKEDCMVTMLDFNGNKNLEESNSVLQKYQKHREENRLECMAVQGSYALLSEYGKHDATILLFKSSDSCLSGEIKKLPISMQDILIDGAFQDQEVVLFTQKGNILPTVNYNLYKYNILF